MAQVLPGLNVEDPFPDPIGQSNDRKDSGDFDGAYKILMDLCQADLCCLDAHSHLGNFVFDHRPKNAIRHYEVGSESASFHLAKVSTACCRGVDRQPAVPALHAWVLCVSGVLGGSKRRGASSIACCGPNPSDNQGARFLIDQVRAKSTWGNRHRSS
jgi:hypothetical protein